MVKVSGTPNLAIQTEKRAWAQSAADVAVSGTASIHLVVLSIMVMMWVKPSDGGNGPTKSMWRWLKRRDGIGIGWTLTWVCTLAFWQLRQLWTQLAMVEFMDFQTNLLLMRRRVALTPGWVML